METNKHENDISTQKCGIHFFLKDGSNDWYDPIDKNDGIRENKDNYIVDNGCYVYEIEKEKVAKYEFYDICKICGHEIEKIDNRICHRCRPDEYDKINS
jgi:hypothetical protein